MSITLKKSHATTILTLLVCQFSNSTYPVYVSKARNVSDTPESTCRMSPSSVGTGTWTPRLAPFLCPLDTLCIVTSGAYTEHARSSRSPSPLLAWDKTSVLHLHCSIYRPDHVAEDVHHFSLRLTRSSTSNRSVVSRTPKSLRCALAALPTLCTPRPIDRVRDYYL